MIVLAGLIFCCFHPGFAFERIFKDRETDGVQSELEVLKYEAVPLPKATGGNGNDQVKWDQNQMGYDSNRN